MSSSTIQELNIEPPSSGKEPTKRNFMRVAQTANSALTPVFDYFDKGDMVPLVIMLCGDDDDNFGTFLHYNTVDEVALILAAKGAPAAYLRSGMLFVGPNEHIVPGFAKGQTNDFFLMFAVQRQSTDSEQIENVTFFCSECQSELYRHKYSASELECAYRFAPAATVQGALDAALAYNADSALQTCNSCGHVNPTFSHRLWGWENQVRGSKLSQLGWDMFEEATRAI